MHNMIAEMIVHSALKELLPRQGDGVSPETRLFTVEMLARPLGIKWRKGITFDTVKVTIRIGKTWIGGGDVGNDVLMTFSRHDLLGLVYEDTILRTLVSGPESARNFLRARLAGEKLIDFKRHDPFYTITTVHNLPEAV